MDVEYVVAIAVILLGVALWGLKKYQVLNADGKVTLDEIIETAIEGAGIAGDAAEEIEEIVEASKAEEAAKAAEAEATSAVDTSGAEVETNAGQ